MSSRQSVISSAADSGDHAAFGAMGGSASLVKGWIKGVTKKDIGARKDRYNLIVMDALKSGGGTSRGQPLWARRCKICLDVQRDCKLADRCPAFRVDMDAWLEKYYLKEAPDGFEVKRQIESLADEGNIRALQVIRNAGGRDSLNKDREVVKSLVRSWQTVLDRQGFIEDRTDEPWSIRTRKEKETIAREFLQKVDHDKDDLVMAAKVADFVNTQEIFLQFKDDFLPKHLQAEAEGKGDGKSDFHAGPKVIEKFLSKGVKDQMRGGEHKRPPTPAERALVRNVLLFYFEKQTQ